MARWRLPAREATGPPRSTLPTAHLGDAGDAAHGVDATDALGATGSAAGSAGGAEAAPSSGFGETIMSQLRPPVEDIVAELTRMPGADGRTEQVSIRLRPEFLGEVVMRISVDADGIVTARFIAEHAFVRSMIEQQLPELRAALAQHGPGAGRCQRGRRRSGPRLERRPVARPCVARRGPDIVFRA